MKTCFKCSESKPLSEFYKHKSMRDGRLNKCKECTKNDVGVHRGENLERIREYDRGRGCRQGATYLSDWRKDNPRKFAAHKAVRAAVSSGALLASACEICEESKTHAHHDDYAYPLDVRWLCAAHHKQWHEINGEAPNGRRLITTGEKPMDRDFIKTGSPKTEGQKQTAAALEKAPRKKLSKIAPGTIAAILGVSPSMKRESVVREMVRAYHGEPSEYVANVAAEYADECRTTAERVFEDKFKLNIWRNDPKKPHKLIGGHQLTIKSAKQEGMGLLYLRMPYGQRSAVGPKDFKTIDEQPHHYAQMQFEMLAAGSTWGVFAQWAACAQRYDIVKLDQGFIDDNLPQLEAFYASLKDECKNKLHLEPLRKSIDNEKARKIIEEFDELSVAITNANARKGELMDMLKEMSGESSSIICGRLMTRTDSEGSISYAQAVKKLLPGANLEEFRGQPSTKWVLT